MAAVYRLGIDFGTSNTVAVLSWPDGRIRPLLFDGSPLLPSAVYAATPAMLVGTDAIHSARVQPELFEPTPKRRIDDGVVVLGDGEHPVADVIGAVLSRVRVEAERTAGEPLSEVTLTCPAAWGSHRRSVLAEAARRAGLGEVLLVPEPTSAAAYFAIGRSVPVAIGACVVVYDLGAGTFDASVVRRTADGFEVLATDGLDDAGGLDIDAAIVTEIGATYGGRDPQRWARLTRPQTAEDRRANVQLWDDVRRAKEMLSRATATRLYLPLFDVDVPLGREQLDRVARPVLDRTITATVRVVGADRLQPQDVAGVFLVGGATRMPLVATLLHQALLRQALLRQAMAVAPTALEQPELAVAEGSLYTAHLRPQAAPAQPVPIQPVPAGPEPQPQAVPAEPEPEPELEPEPEPAWPPTAPLPMVDVAVADVAVADVAVPASGRARQRRRWMATAGAALVVLVATVGVVIAVNRWSTQNPGAQSPGAGSGASASPAGVVCGYKLAFIGALTGSQAAIGTDMSKGATLAVEQFNAKHPSCVTLVPLDSQSSATTATGLAGRAIADGSVLGVVGPLFSAEVDAAGRTLNLARLAMISPSATRGNLSTRQWQVFHRLVADDSAQGAAAGRMIKEVLKPSAVFAVDDGSEHGAAVANEVRGQLGDTMVGSERVTTPNPQQADLRRLVSRIRSSGAGVVFVGGTAGLAGPLLNQMRGAGVTATMVTGNGVDGRSLVDIAGAANAEGTFIVCSCVPTQSLRASFVNDYVKRFGSPPGVYSGSAFDAANIFLAGFEAGSANRPAMLAFVDRYRGDGVAGSYRFTASGELDREVAVVWAFRVHNGQVEPVQTAPRP